MTQQGRDDLWRDFPKTATEFEARFATEAVNRRGIFTPRIASSADVTLAGQIQRRLIACVL